MLGLGTQDDFPLAIDFVDSGGLDTPIMLWDPSFVTWRSLGVVANSQMMLVSSDLSAASDLMFGFDDAQQQAILDALPGIQNPQTSG